MIVIGYQGIGKSTLSYKNNKFIDLESSNFFINDKRNKDWYKIYSQIADSLSKQGFIVFVSSHKKVRNELYENSDEQILKVFPSLELKEKWIEKLKNRYLSTFSLKDFKAYKNASYHDENINELLYEESNSNVSNVVINNMDYNLSDLINSNIDISIKKYYKKYYKKHKELYNKIQSDVKKIIINNGFIEKMNDFYFYDIFNKDDLEFNIYESCNKKLSLIVFDETTDCPKIKKLILNYLKTLDYNRDLINLEYYEVYNENKFNSLVFNLNKSIIM